MGNATLTTTSYKPANPYNTCRKALPVDSSRPHWKLNSSVLQQLILLQDWHRVLIRINLYPPEVSQYVILHFADAQQQLLVLPLHLACALDPPLEVIEALLHHNVEAVTLPIQVITGGVVVKKIDRDRRWKPALWSRIHVWKHRRLGSFPCDSINIQKQRKMDDQQVLLPKKEQNSPQTSAQTTAYFTTRQIMEDESNFTDGEQSGPHSSHSSLSSRLSWERKNNVILQLGPSEGLKTTPFPMNKTVTTTGSSNTSSPVFRVKWDLEPLIQHVCQKGELLPLHIACLYRSCDKVVQVLVDASPSVALVSILGMLPIHWVAAGWVLPPLQQQLSNTPISSPSTPSKTCPLLLLTVLQCASPESVRVQSGNHVMTPMDYVEECLEEGGYKNACMAALMGDAAWDGVETISSASSIFFCDSDSDITGNHGPQSASSLLNSRFSTSNNNKKKNKELIACITALIADRNWEQVLALVEDDPSLAGYWLYGMDKTEACSSSGTPVVVWKRLPIHLACLKQAPVGVISVLLDSYPAGAATADPQYGMVPLHMAAKHGAGLHVVNRLLDSCPEATMAVDEQGQVPLHTAVQSMAVSYAVVEALLERDPYSALAVDGNGKTPTDYARQLHGSASLITEFVETVALFHQYSE